MSLFLPYLDVYAGMEKRQEENKKKILKEWKESANYPRKKKKAVRKRLNLEWSIANWNPFEF